MAQGRGAIVVTGASSGIGQAAALALARVGWYVFGGVRTARDAADLAALAGGRGLGALVQPILLDVTDSAQIYGAQELVAKTLREHCLHLIGLVNNAGIAIGGPLEEVPLARLHEIFAVNVVGVVAVTQAFLPLLRVGRGRIVNISSVSGRVAAPFLGPYAASKFALEALSDALRVELRPWGIAVVVIEPGPISTPIWNKTTVAAATDREGLDANSPYAAIIPRVQAAIARSARSGLPADDVAGVIITALTTRRPRARYLVARRPLFFAAFVRLVPDGVRDLLFARGL
ncbi:MAG TPA: SDR family NAD(P)-dependent oxidoreductase [Thermomicrobiales bacterium]